MNNLLRPLQPGSGRGEVQTRGSAAPGRGLFLRFREGRSWTWGEKERSCGRAPQEGIPLGRPNAGFYILAFGANVQSPHILLQLMDTSDTDTGNLEISESRSGPECPSGLGSVSLARNTPSGSAAQVAGSLRGDSHFRLRWGSPLARP